MATTQRSRGVAHTLALASLLLQPLGASAQWYEEGFGGYADAFAGRTGPYDANSTEFLAAIDASNATGIFKIPGYDVSKPYPGAAIDGWTLQLAALDLSHPAMVHRTYSDGELLSSNLMVGYSLTIKAPDALLKPNPADEGRTKLVDTDPSWGMCMWNFGHPGPSNTSRYNNPSNKPLSPDGSCAGFLSDACVAALEKATASAFSVAASAAESKGRYGSLVTCQSLHTPDECGDHGPGNAGSALPSYGGVPIRFLNGSVTASDGWLFEEDQGWLYNSTKDLHDYWDSMVLNYWVVVTALVNATADPDRSGIDRGLGRSRVSCVAPNGEGTGMVFNFFGLGGANVQSGSGSGSGGEGGGSGTGTKPAGEGDSGAAMVGAAGWGVWAVSMLSFALLFS